MIIAIDGYSSCGKSTLAKDLAADLHFTYLDSGAMYRAVTLFFLDNAVNIDDKEAVEAALLNIDIQFEKNSNRTLLNELDIEAEIRSPRVTDYVSPVSAISSVRRKMVEQQRALGQAGNIVMDGRDIGTVVFPNAQLKVFLTASDEVRTDRRWQEMQRKGFEITKQRVLESLKSRDHIDSNRSDSPLRQAEDAILLDNSNLSRNEQKAMVLAVAKLRETI